LLSQLRYFLTDSRTLALIGIALMAALFYAGPNTLKTAAFWLGISLVAVLLVLLGLWLARVLRARSASRQIGDALLQASGAGSTAHGADTETLHARLRDAVKTIKTSKLGQTRGNEALYELPWYMIIGNPAAGKSTAIANSGLRLPFADSQGSIVQGIGGTRNCDWYFTTEGILLDTAGRYSVHEEDRAEWLGFLGLLRKYRPRAPINGIIIAVSIAELTSSRPEFAISLAKNLRQRVQELTESLEVIAPVYVLFTKADLIAGFNDFFRGLDDAERERVWGATLPFQPTENGNAGDDFDRYFDELAKGVKELSLAQMALSRGNAVAPGLLTLPLEFSGVKNILRTFITTLFEDNPFQFKPVFRGFYFTSALQEAASVQAASDRISQRYGLGAPVNNRTDDETSSTRSYFLQDLFRKVIFADRQLVQQYSSRNRQQRRYAIVFGSALVLGLALAGWTWSYLDNKQLVANVQANLDKVTALQKGRVDLQSRLQALLLLQDRLIQLEAYRSDRPLQLGLGLYQGEAIEAKLRTEYFEGMRRLMLLPTQGNIETYLSQVNAAREQLKPPRSDTAADGSKATETAGGSPYQGASPTDSQDAYNALKTYLMLQSPERADATHLGDQLARFWREWLYTNRGAMSREEMVSSADRLLGYYLRQAGTPGWPKIEAKLSLIDDTRQALNGVMHGERAIDRVYAQIKAHAAPRFPPISVAQIVGDQAGSLVVGSHAISGVFSREAWSGYIRNAIQEAAYKEVSSTDWVLNTPEQHDLQKIDFPENIQKQLEAKYAQEYIAEWKQFLQSVSVAPFPSFPVAVANMNTLGDPESSPLRKLMETAYRETSWDNPSLLNQGLKSASGGFVSWFRRVILRQSPSGTAELEQAAAGGNGLQVGPVGREFTGIARLMIARDGHPPLMQNYLAMLAKLRTRLNAIKNQGDPGPGARELMQKTLAGNGSELSDGLQLVDEQMLNGLGDGERKALRPLLLRPLIQTFSALVSPTEIEINKVWAAEIYTPFEADLAKKIPFSDGGQVQATEGEIARVFGPEGTIAKFAGDTLGPLVNRRGNALTAKQWGEVGITLTPQLVSNLAQWVAPLGQTVSGASETVFQIAPEPTNAGISEYSIRINGETLRYRNTPAGWKTFVWSGGDAATVEITAVTYDGRTVNIENLVGADALKQLFRDAKGGRDASGIYTLTWSNDNVSVTVKLRVVSSAQANADGSQKRGLQGTKLPLMIVGNDTASSVSVVGAAQ